MNKYNTILRECNYTNLKRHLFVNDFFLIFLLLSGEVGIHVPFFSVFLTVLPSAYLEADGLLW